MTVQYNQQRCIFISTKGSYTLTCWRPKVFFTKWVHLGENPSQSETVPTDSSLPRWRALWCPRCIGAWTHSVGSQHINLPELKAYSYPQTLSCPNLFRQCSDSQVHKSPGFHKVKPLSVLSLLIASLTQGNLHTGSHLEKIQPCKPSKLTTKPSYFEVYSHQLCQTALWDKTCQPTP